LQRVDALLQLGFLRPMAAQSEVTQSRQKRHDLIP
jgi:hypothetical protein